MNARHRVWITLALAEGAVGLYFALRAAAVVLA
jgi:hypothetical protein